VIEMPVSRAEYLRDPYRYLAAYRGTPIAWADFFGDQVWLVTGYPEADQMMKDARFLRDGRGVAPEAAASTSPIVDRALQMKHRTILMADAPYHPRVRGVMHRAFTPGMQAQLVPLAERVALDLLRERRGETSHELIEQFTDPLPLLIIAAVLGLPPDDRELYRHWPRTFARFIDFSRSPEEIEAAARAMLDAQDYLRKVLEAKRRAPGDDVVSRMLVQQAAGAEVSDDELIASTFLLLCAGHVTTVNFIATAYCTLLKHPQQYALLRADLSLSANAVEELLRFEPTVFTTSRWVSEDVDFHGHALRRGQLAVIAIGAVNRDPRVTPDPDRLDITRHPVKHLSFASGSHYCLGAPLGRLEARVALEALVRYLGNPTLPVEPGWRDSLDVRGLQALEVGAEVLL
jgi:cytochrome P450